MKIGFITERMLLGFGVDLVIDQTARGLAKKGHEITVFPSIADETFDKSDSGYRILPLNVPANAIAPRYELNAFKKAGYLNRQDIDVFVVETFPFFSYAFLLKKPVIIVDHGVSSSKGFPLKIRANFSYISFMQRYIYFPFAKHIITVSGFIQKNYPFYIKKKCSVIYNGTDHYKNDTDQKDIDIRKELNINKDSVLMLYVGRLNPAGQPYKGTRELLDNFIRIKSMRPETELLMVGYGNEDDKRYIEKYGVKVMLKAPADLMRQIFMQSDIYVSCSKWEGFNLPAAEAQTFGKPVVLYRAGAHPEIVRENETGFLVNNCTEFIDKACKLASDPELRKEYSTKCKKHMEEFTWEKASEKYHHTIARVVS